MKKTDSSDRRDSKQIKRYSVVITAAGSGSRFGSDQPKQFLMIQDKPMIIHSISAFLSDPIINDQQVLIKDIIITIQDAYKSALESLISQYVSAELATKIKLVPGGKTRQLSVFNGIQSISGHIDGVVIHDGARPHIGTDLILRVLNAGKIHKAVIPVIPVTDTIKQVDQDQVSAHLDRAHLAAVQTPQYFELDSICAAYKKVDISDPKVNITDESMLMDTINEPVKTVVGDISNIKVTYPSDIETIQYKTV